MPVEQTNVAWAAGIFDYGAYVKERNRTLYLRIWFAFVDDPKAARFRRIMTAGKIYGPYRRGGRLQWQYELTGRARVCRAIGMLRPYLTNPSGFDRLFPMGEAPLEMASSSLIEEAQIGLPSL